MKIKELFPAIIFFALLFSSCGTGQAEKENQNVNDTIVAKQKETASTSELTCPECGNKQQEVLPTEQCLISYVCSNCKKTIYPQDGDCCVFCSYGTEKCPSKQ